MSGVRIGVMIALVFVLAIPAFGFGPGVDFGDRGVAGVTVSARSDRVPSAKPRVLNIDDFGAIEGGSINSRAAIQAAIDTASANGGLTVHVPAGLYRVAGKIHMRSGVTLEGVGDESVLWASGDWDLLWFEGTAKNPVRDTSVRRIHLKGPGTQSTNFSTLIAMREYVVGSVIDNCLLTDSGYDAWHALREVSDVQVTNNRVRDCFDDGLNPGGWSGGLGTHDILIRGNTIENVVNDGIHLSFGSYNITTVDNTIIGSGTGIGLKNTANGVVEGNTIIGCGTGILTVAGRSAGMDILNNRIEQSATSGIHFTGYRSTLVGNVVLDSGVHGIFVDSASGRSVGLLVQSNVVERSFFDGIRIDMECGFVFENTVRDSGGLSIHDYQRYNRVIFNDVDGSILNFAGDTNCDQSIDDLDLDVILRWWGKCVDPDGLFCDADVNGDGMVDQGDLDIVRQNLGR